MHSIIDNNAIKNAIYYLFKEFSKLLWVHVSCQVLIALLKNNKKFQSKVIVNFSKFLEKNEKATTICDRLKMLGLTKRISFFSFTRKFVSHSIKVN